MLPSRFYHMLYWYVPAGVKQEYVLHHTLVVAFWNLIRFKVCCYTSLYNEMIPNLEWFDLHFLDFTRVWKKYALVYFDFWSFLGVLLCGIILS